MASLVEEESLKEKSAKVRTRSSNHKVKDNDSIKQICLCVYLYTEIEADLAPWYMYKKKVTHWSEMNKWQSCTKREKNGQRPTCKGGLYTVLIILMSLHTQHTCRLTITQMLHQ